MSEPKLSAEVLAEIFECDRWASRDTMSVSRKRLRKLLAENDFAVVAALRAFIQVQAALLAARGELVEIQQLLGGAQGEIRTLMESQEK